ncbi:hypothetical protein ASE03_22325 [Kitasatospora sp. Root187]|nr:hypothetical protein ASC99_34985 [Kitasatospora sp. Root107]KRB72662.1 hypothetical protein ASE03_22325 [Kitasatospora sp. Root187]
MYIEFPHWADAEKTAAEHLAPVLRQAEAEHGLASWWFIRKAPCWRLRLLAQPGSETHDLVTAALDDLTDAGLVLRYWHGIYEPETAAFGGPAAMTLAHDLFHADSRAVLDPHSRARALLGQRELSILLSTTMLHAGRLEWFEQGDVWHLVAAERPLPADAAPVQLQQLADDLGQLLRADTAAAGSLFGPGRPLAPAGRRADAFRQAGRALGTAARTGALDRGLRQVLAYHLIFHFNRCGLPTRTQSILAAAARTAILGPRPDVPRLATA